jgi:hypothetical protein
MANEEDEVTRARHQHEAEAKAERPTRTKTRTSRDDSADDDYADSIDREALRVRDEDDGLTPEERKVKHFEEIDNGIPPGVPGSPGQPEFVPMGVADENGEPVDPPEVEPPEGLTATSTEEEVMAGQEEVNEQQEEATEAIRQQEVDAGKEHEENLPPAEKERLRHKGLLHSEKSKKETAKAQR